MRGPARQWQKRESRSGTSSAASRKHGARATSQWREHVTGDNEKEWAIKANECWWQRFNETWKPRPSRHISSSSYCHTTLGLPRENMAVTGIHKSWSFRFHFRWNLEACRSVVTRNVLLSQVVFESFDLICFCENHVRELRTFFTRRTWAKVVSNLSVKHSC